jgi:hypothetical protein
MRALVVRTQAREELAEEKLGRENDWREEVTCAHT